MNKKQLYESIMMNVAKEVKKALNEAVEIPNDIMQYNEGEDDDDPFLNSLVACYFSEGPIGILFLCSTEPEYDEDDEDYDGDEGINYSVFMPMNVVYEYLDEEMPATMSDEEAQNFIDDNLMALTDEFQDDNGLFFNQPSWEFVKLDNRKKRHK